MRRTLTSLLAVGVAFAVLVAPAGRAADPASGNLDASSPEVRWQGEGLLFTTVGTGCEPAGPTCDVFDLLVGPLSPAAPDVVISGSASSSSDVLFLYVYDDAGAQVASDTTIAANPTVTLRDVAPGAYSVRFEALLGTAPVSYDAVARAVDAGEALDEEVPCVGDDQGLGPPPQPVLDAALADDSRPVRLDVLVLLEGVDEGFARTFFEKVAAPYRDLAIEVVPTFRPVPPGAITSDVTTEIIDQTKNLLPGRRVPDEFDVVELLTHRDIEALGVKAVAGQAECIGGAAFKQHSFNVSEAQAHVDQAGVAFGPVVLVPEVAAKITAHEVGHLFGAQHHFANCAEAVDPVRMVSTDASPCTLMFNTSDLIALKFGTVNGRIIRGYALTYAAANDPTP